MNTDQKDKIIEILNSIVALPQKSINSHLSIINIKSFKDSIDFIEKGKYNQSEYFVLDGICKSYVLNSDGKEVTISFYKEGDVLPPYISRTIKDTSNLNFKSISELTLGEFNAREFEELMIEDMDLRFFGHMVLQNELLVKVEKEVALASLSAKDRLIQFREKFKNFENLVSHQDIATYLGITNVSLSRLRKDLL